MSDRLKKLSEAGVSIWLDDLSRERIETGNLADLVKNSSVVGITSNPTIFAAALSDGERYDEQVRRLAADGADVERTVFELTTTDVRDACDIMRPVWEATGGVDGRVSIEVTPDVAHDTDSTVAQAKELWEAVDRPNAYIKIPGTPEGLPAITETLAAGIDVNVTLIFGLDQYQGVMEAFVAGLEITGSGFDGGTSYFGLRRIYRDEDLCIDLPDAFDHTDHAAKLFFDGYFLRAFAVGLPFRPC